MENMVMVKKTLGHLAAHRLRALCVEWIHLFDITR
jgi:hypothetical protein